MAGITHPKVGATLRYMHNLTAANRGHVSLDQLKVMSAIERCRTAALGGHVARCENAACGHTEIAYNSCLMGKSINGELAAT
jgi:hypothetical protein